jgi:hypothetical protein
VTAEFAALDFPATNLKVSGQNVTVTGAAAKATPNACTDKFVPMPK